MEIMTSALSQYTPSHTHLICIDSDGCGMDTMTIKHERAFGPAILDIWELDAHRDHILKRWNTFNLYEITRGINRFKGLEKMLTELHTQGITVEDYEDIKQWVDHTSVFSNPQLEKDILHNPEKTGLKRALAWSLRVNEKIKQLPSVGPFSHVKASLEKVSQVADVVIVSSANQSAVENEWQHHGLMPYISGLFAQEAGTKEHCISKLKAHYQPEHMIMIGDAEGDLKAAQTNNIFFYPILAHHENASWKKFYDVYSDLFISNTFDQTVQNELIQTFYQNFEGAK